MAGLGTAPRDLSTLVPDSIQGYVQILYDYPGLDCASQHRQYKELYRIVHWMGKCIDKFDELTQVH